MGTFSDTLRNSDEVRLERMRPEQIARAKARCPWIYLAFGSIEWHGYHNAVGLDAVKAHEQLVGLARRIGGLVYPPLFLGVGGGHTEWASSFMVSREPMIQIVTDLLQGFERDGYKQVIMLSGHYPNRGEFLDPALQRYQEQGGTMRVLPLVENQAPGVGGDHAATYETSFMLHLHPDLVDVERLAQGCQDDIGGVAEIRNWMAPAFEGHPCYGLVGTDPRAHASADLGKEHTDQLLAFLTAWLKGST